MLWLTFKLVFLFIVLCFFLPVFSLLTSTEQKLCPPLPSSPSTFLPFLLPLFFLLTKTIPANSYMWTNSFIIKLKNYVISYTRKEAFESQTTTLHFGRAASSIFQSHVCRLLKIFQTAMMWCLRTLYVLVYLRSRWSFTATLITTWKIYPTESSEGKTSFWNLLSWGRRKKRENKTINALKFK